METDSVVFFFCLSVQAHLTYELKSPHRNARNANKIATRAIAWSPDGKYFAWSCGNGYVVLCPWDAQLNKISLESKHTIDCGEHVCSLAFSTAPKPKKLQQDYHLCNGDTTILDDGSNHDRPCLIPFDKCLVLAVGVSSGRIQLWNAYSGHLLLYLHDHTKQVSCLDFAPNSSLMLLSGSHDGTLKFWDLHDDGNMTHTLQMPMHSAVYCCKFSPQANYLAATGINRLVVICETSKSKRSDPVRKLYGHQNVVVSCDFSPDGALLATASYDTRVIIWNWYKGVCLRQLGHLFPAPRPIFAGGANEYHVRSVAFCDFGTNISTVADDGYVRVWNLLSLSKNPEVIVHLKNALCCSFCPNNSLVAVGTQTGDVCFYTIPYQPPKLQHLCRRVLRFHLSQPDSISRLDIPAFLKKYLSYKVW
ncbi:WD repeat and SOCS box-containing protein 1 [Octopus sinensis]|uniref:WD repeat and SOCS box-containing protein 1 n=1 Tax=Octopus sinensis TaxID=2607531 RepID=A0A6P7TWG7_9MOLL|nr:WD repeat and SOCS box-containing protein 1 [Octopus sinensis]